MILNLQGHAEEVSNVPVVVDVEKDGDGPEDPENAGDEDESVGPEVEPVVALAVREQNIVDCDFLRCFDIFPVKWSRELAEFVLTISRVTNNQPDDNRLLKNSTQFDKKAHLKRTG
jgi:hypothetical protein